MSFIGARIALRAYNGKYLCSGDNGTLKLSNCSDMSPEIIFFVPLASSNVYVQNHKREFVSVKDDGGMQLLQIDSPLGTKEAFDFFCLGANRAAVRAHNGKYMSVQNTPADTLAANSDSIGQKETFEVIPVFR